MRERGLHFRKYVKFTRKENKKSQSFDDSGVFAPDNVINVYIYIYKKKTMLSFKGMRFCSMFGNNHKKVFGKLIERHFE